MENIENVLSQFMQYLIFTFSSRVPQVTKEESQPLVPPRTLTLV